MTIGTAVVTAALAITLGWAAPASAATATVDLGTSGTYSVLAAQAVTNTGPSVLNGDLGLSPNTGSSITGFPPGLVGGTTHAGDAPALQAQSDLTTAYNDAAGRAPTQSVGGDLVGTTKVAGVYKSTGPLALSGSLTLDGQHDPNSVFIFQVGSTLTTATASSVKLINGAQACHVFWQVGSSATLGTASVFRGTITALTSITVNTNVLVQGRALARNGSVTLDSDTFISANCGTTPAGQTTTTQSLPPGPVNVGDTVPVHVTVTGTGPTTPTGTVTVYVNGVPVGNGPVDNAGHVAITIPAGSTPGPLIITSHYGGSPTNLPSNSPPGTVIVHASPTSTASHSPSAPSTAGTSTASTSRTATATPITTGAHASTVPLAATGANQASPLTVLAAVLLTVGSAFLLIARRQRNGRHRS